jgi:hypothetical protein
VQYLCHFLPFYVTHLCVNAIAHRQLPFRYFLRSMEVTGHSDSDAWSEHGLIHFKWSSGRMFKWCASAVSPCWMLCASASPYLSECCACRCACVWW